MQEEFNQFERNQVWRLVSRSQNRSSIGTKWVFRNKLDESGTIIRNKDRLVAQHYNQNEGINFEEPVERLKPIIMTLAYASYKDFKLYQMDVKSASLNEFI